MAQIIFAQTVSSIVGKMGSTVFQRGLASPTIKSIPHRRNYQYINQIAPLSKQVHAKFSQVAQTWQTLTGTQQAAWAAVCSSFSRVNRLGAIYTPSAYQLFCEMNFALNLLNGNIIITPPATSIFVASVYSVAYNSGAGTLIVSQSVIYTDSPYKTIIYAGTYQSNGLGYRAGLMKIITLYQFTAIATTYDISAAFQGLYGSYIAGKKAYILIKQINTTTGELHSYGYYPVNF